MLTPKEQADRRIEAMRQEVIAADMNPSDITFRGIPIREFTRDQLEVMLARELKKNNELMEPDRQDDKFLGG